MKRESAGPIYTTVFVDYDNIYMSLRRKNEDAAKRFAKDSGVWLQALISGELITPSSVYSTPVERRLAMTRCYGNSTPRRNSHDNSTDMNSFPFVKHHFLRAGFEIIDCPPMTQQLKNAADIRMVLDIGDILTHNTFFHEIVILSGDADFTPLLHRLRAHARRSVVFANDSTAQPFTAISDGEVRESNLISLLLDGRAVAADAPARELAAPRSALVDLEEARRATLAEVVSFVRAAPQSVPLETLADRAVRIVGRDKTVDCDWGGYGSFHKLLLSGLPDDLHLSDTPPYTVFDEKRHITATGLLGPQVSSALASIELRASAPEPSPLYRPEPHPPQIPSRHTEPLRQYVPTAPSFSPAPHDFAAQPNYSAALETSHLHQPALNRPTDAFYAPPPAASAQASTASPLSTPHGAPQPFGDLRRDAPITTSQSVGHQAPRAADHATQIQQSISRIHQACQAPALAPAEYRVLFDIMAHEITANGLLGSQTLVNLTQRAREFGLDLKRDDLRFILDVVSESDPWFEQGASASLFASRFRNFVVARCRSQGLSLSSDELDLIEAWFSSQPQAPRAPAYGRTAPPPPAAQQTQPSTAALAAAQGGDRWWSLEDGRQQSAEPQGGQGGGYGAGETIADDEFPRIVRTRLRG
ncbi:MAG: NYN domain-containing protein [Hyphomicrobium sp.]